MVLNICKTLTTTALKKRVLEFDSVFFSRCNLCLEGKIFKSTREKRCHEERHGVHQDEKVPDRN